MFPEPHLLCPAASRPLEGQRPPAAARCESAGRRLRVAARPRAGRGDAGVAWAAIVLGMVLRLFVRFFMVFCCCSYAVFLI